MFPYYVSECGVTSVKKEFVIVFVYRVPRLEDVVYTVFCKEKIEHCIIQQKTGYHMSDLLQAFRRCARGASDEVREAVESYT